MRQRMKTLNYELTELLSNAIESRGLNAPDLALRMGVGAEQVVDWLRSPIHTPLCHLSRMAVELRVVEEFMTAVHAPRLQQAN